MGRVSVDNLQIGMKTTRDVLDRNGRMLLTAGSELTQKHLTIFRTWGVAEVMVEEPDDPEIKPLTTTEIDDESILAATASVLPRFAFSGTEHPALQELLRLAALKEVQHGLC